MSEWRALFTPLKVFGFLFTVVSALSIFEVFADGSALCKLVKVAAFVLGGGTAVAGVQYQTPANAQILARREVAASLGLGETPSAAAVATIVKDITPKEPTT